MNRRAWMIAVVAFLLVASTACSPAPVVREESISATAWPKAVRALDPVDVYMHRMNTVVVLDVIDGVEYGKYIYNPVSSYRPQSGDEGFTFTSGPTDGARFGVGCEVFEFRREREEKAR